MLPSPRIFRSPYGPKWGPGRLATSTTGYHHRHCTAMQPCCHATATEPDQGTFSFALVTMLVTTYLSYWTLTTYVGLFLNSLHPPLLPWRTKQLPKQDDQNNLDSIFSDRHSESNRGWQFLLQKQRKCMDLMQEMSNNRQEMPSGPWRMSLWKYSDCRSRTGWKDDWRIRLQRGLLLHQ